MSLTPDHPTLPAGTQAPARRASPAGTGARYPAVAAGDWLLAPGPARRGYVVLGLMALLGLVGGAGGYLVDPPHFFMAYLVAWCFAATLILGLLFFIMLHHVVDAAWSVVVRRSAELVVVSLPVLAVLALPLLAGMDQLYPWLHPELLHGPERDLILAKQPYLNRAFFLLRLAAYLLVWLGLAWLFCGLSFKQDRGDRPHHSFTLRRWSGPGLIVFGVTFTFAFIDLLMTLEPAWFSTIFGVYVFAGAAVGGLALLTLLALALRSGPLESAIRPDHLHDLGKLLFAFAVFWAYIAFSQYFLIWYANIPEETLWFLHRWHGSWKGLSLLLPLLLFAAPFVGIMRADAKRRAWVMILVSLAVLLGHYLEMYWIAMPALHRQGPAWSRWWIDLATLLLIVGALGLAVVRAMTRHPLLPLYDPRLDESLAGQEG